MGLRKPCENKVQGLTIMAGAELTLSLLPVGAPRVPVPRDCGQWDAGDVTN